MSAFPATATESDVPSGPRPSVSADLLCEVQQFLYWEAELLDQRRYLEWIGLFADEVHYWMPTRCTRLADAETGARPIERELSGPGELAFFDDDKAVLLARVLRMQSKTAWSENPPSRTRRLVGNVRVGQLGSDSRLEVRSNFVLYRTRHESSENLFVGQRQDLLLRVGEDLRISRRKIVLDSNVLVSPNLSVFF